MGPVPPGCAGMGAFSCAPSACLTSWRHESGGYMSGTLQGCIAVYIGVHIRAFIKVHW